MLLPSEETERASKKTKEGEREREREEGNFVCYNGELSVCACVFFFAGVSGYSLKVAETQILAFR